MTQYILSISTYSGLVPGATHYRGRVKGPYPESCHGGTRMGATKSGKTECYEGHVLPDQVAWDVEAAWTVERYERWAANRFESDGPQAFYTSRDVIDRAVIQFLDGSGGGDRFWEEEVAPAEDGDELWYGWVNSGEADDLTDPSDGWGMMIARADRG